MFRKIVKQQKLRNSPPTSISPILLRRGESFRKRKMDKYTAPKENYLADLLRKSLMDELEHQRELILKEANEKFNKKADEIIKTKIFNLAEKIRIEENYYPFKDRREIIINLPVLQEIER
jgi:hypothetical protein